MKVTLLLLAVSLQPLIETSVVTSYEKLRKLVDKGDDALIQSIGDVIKEGQERIKNLTSILMQRLKTPKQDYKFQGDHPNDFYLLVKHHVISWFDSGIEEDLFPVVEEVIKKRNISFPVLEDFSEAAKALIRLQYVYKMEAQDMFEGNYLGYKGSPLDTIDAYMMGKQAFASGHLPEAKEWLQKSADLLTEAMENQKQDSSAGGQEAIEELREDYYFTLSLLGRAHLYMNGTEMARKLYAQCIDSGLTDIADVEELGQELEVNNITRLLEEYVVNVDEGDKYITALCSREKDHRVKVIRPYHVCRYKSDPFIPYRRFREEILSTSPYASVFYDVMHDAEIEKLKSISMTRLGRAEVLGNKGGEVSNHRTGDLGWVKDSDDPLVASVSQRVKAFTRLEVAHRDDGRLSSEHFQVVNYGMGGHYGVHLDALKPEEMQDRLATVLLYLTDVEKGGATIFPIVGVSVTPIKGMALLWYNYRPDMRDVDDDTLHAGCPVLMGNKWIANKWIWTYGNTFRRPCGPSPQSQQPDVENIVTVDALKEIIE